MISTANIQSRVTCVRTRTRARNIVALAQSRCIGFISAVSQQALQRPAGSRSSRSSSRRAVLMLLAGALAASSLPSTAIAVDDAPPAAAAKRGPTPIEFSFAPPSVKESLTRRDKAMEFQCGGGMMDCDGEKAEKQRKNIEELSQGDAQMFKVDEQK